MVIAVAVVVSETSAAEYNERVYKDGDRLEEEEDADGKEEHGNEEDAAAATAEFVEVAYGKRVVKEVELKRW